MFTILLYQAQNYTNPSKFVCIIEMTVALSIIAKIPKIPLEKSKGNILLIKNQNFTKSRHFPPTHLPNTRQQTVLRQLQIVGFQTRYRNLLQIGKE